MAQPRILDLDLEAVTPLWIGGASYQGELRAPSFRGCLRFWLRALLGGTLGETLEDIHAVEGAVFGSTARASAVVVRLTGTPSIGLVSLDPPELPPGLAYLLWSVLGQKRTAILPGQHFRFRLQSRLLPLTPVQAAGRTIAGEDSFTLALTALWLLLRLGAVGCRARRGGGGLRVVAPPAGWPAFLPSLVSSATTPAELAAELAAGLRQLRQLLGWQGPAPVEPSSFDLLHEKVFQLYLLDKTFPSWWEALAWVGEKYHAFRVDQREDASGIAGLLTRGRLAVRTIVRAVFGLPIPFFFKSIHGPWWLEAWTRARPGGRPPPRWVPPGARVVAHPCSSGSSSWRARGRLAVPCCWGCSARAWCRTTS